MPRSSPFAGQRTRPKEDEPCPTVSRRSWRRDRPERNRTSPFSATASLRVTRRPTTTRSMSCSWTAFSARDYFYEDKSAYNIFRVNLISAQSGVSTAGLQRARNADRPVGRHDHVDDDQEHRARLHLQRLLGALLARRRGRDFDQGAERAQRVGARLRPRRDHPQQPGLRRMRRRRVPDRHDGGELERDGARVRPRYGRARRRVLREARHVLRWRAGLAEPHDQHEPGDAQVAAVCEPAHPGPDRSRFLRGLYRRLQSRPAGATPTTPASSRAAAPGRAGSTARRSTAGCGATRLRTARSATRG